MLLTNGTTSQTSVPEQQSVHFKTRLLYIHESREVGSNLDGRVCCFLQVSSIHLSSHPYNTGSLIYPSSSLSPLLSTIYFPVIPTLAKDFNV